MNELERNGRNTFDTSSEVSPSGPSVMESGKNLAMAVYILQALAFVMPLTAIVGVCIAHVKRSDFAGTWLASHFTWQIRTFWYGLLWGILGALTIWVMVGYLLLVGLTIWTIYRIVKGLIYLSDKRPLYSV